MLGDVAWYCTFCKDTIKCFSSSSSSSSGCLQSVRRQLWLSKSHQPQRDSWLQRNSWWSGLCVIKITVQQTTKKGTSAACGCGWIVPLNLKPLSAMKLDLWPINPALIFSSWCWICTGLLVKGPLGGACDPSKWLQGFSSSQRWSLWQYSECRFFHSSAWSSCEISLNVVTPSCSVRMLRIMSCTPLVLITNRPPPTFTRTAIIADRIHQRRCWVWFNFEGLRFDDNTQSCGHALQRDSSVSFSSFRLTD